MPKFPDFTQDTTPDVSDHLVGYTGDGQTAGQERRYPIENIIQSASLGGPIYNALTDPDSTIEADYTDRLSPGTDQMGDIRTWIENGVSNGKRRFFFPAGHYNVENIWSGGAADVDGYDDVEIFGEGVGRTVFHTPQGMELKDKNQQVFRFGLTTKTRRGSVHGITFINDPYATDSAESALDNDIRWGWKYYEPHRESQAYETGDIIVSSDDSWLITVTAGGTSSATEPTWSGGTTADGTCTVSVVALGNWTASTGYTAGDHVKTTAANNYHTAIGSTTRSIMIAGNTGTSGTVEANLALPSNDGASGATSEHFWQWLAFGWQAEDSYIHDCEFQGICGFGEAGGTCFGFSGGGGGRVERCYFHDAAYGGVVSGLFRNWTFRDCKHYKQGGWGYCWGTYNAHSYYCQGARNLWDNCTFDYHFYGLDIKVHANPSNNDVWQNRVINCRFSNYGWGSVQWVNPIAATSHSDFVPQGTSGSIHSAILCKQGEVMNCTFRIFKSAYDDFDWRRPTETPNSGSGWAVAANTSGINVVGCDFTDTFGCSAGSTTGDYGTSNTSISVTGCSFDTIFRKGYSINTSGIYNLTTCRFDYRALLGWSNGVTLRSYSTMTNCQIFATTTAYGAPDAGCLKIDGSHVTVDNVKIYLSGRGIPFCAEDGSGTNEHVSVTNCRFIAPHGTMYSYPSGNAKYWTFKNNYWKVDRGWDYFRLTNTKHLSWVWENDSGNLWTSSWNVARATGSLTVAVQPTAGDTLTIGDETFTFVASSTQEFEIEIGVDLGTTQSNIEDVIDGTDTYHSTNYWVTASAFSSNVSTLTAVKGGTGGNGIALSETFTSGSNVVASMSGGVDYMDYHSGVTRLVKSAARQFTDEGLIVDYDGEPTTSVGAIYGVSRKVTDYSEVMISTSEGANHWIHVTGQVTITDGQGDWLKLSSTSGKLEPNGTTGSTTRPSDGIQARVIEVGTASAGAGRCLVEVLEWNRVASAGTYTHPNHTGDVTSVGDGATTIADSAVTLAKMADMATASLLGRDTAGTGAPEVLSAADSRTLLDVWKKDDTRQQVVWVPATAMTPATTNGAAEGTTETTTNDVMLPTLDFDTATEEHAQFWVSMPKSWIHGTDNINARFLWTHDATTVNFGVTWTCEGISFTNDDAIDGTAFGGGVGISDTGGTTGDLYDTGYTTNMTIQNTPASEDAILFRVSRDVGNASDTMAIDAKLIGVCLLLDVNSFDDN